MLFKEARNLDKVKSVNSMMIQNFPGSLLCLPGKRDGSIELMKSFSVPSSNCFPGMVRFHLAIDLSW